MKGFLKTLSPFSPDQSGAVSVLYEFGGLLVIIDAGGCAGNVCGFDEPRWFMGRSAVFSAGLRDMDAILGRDDRLMDKIADALRYVDASFIGLIGTPVPAVIGTDYQALRRMAEKRFGLPVLAVDTNGMDTYERGEEKAYRALLELFADSERNPASAAAKLFASADGSSFQTGILGATPLNLPTLKSAELMEKRAGEKYGGRAVCLGFGSSFAEWKHAPQAERNLAVSPSGAAAAQVMKERYGIPYECAFPVSAEEVFGTGAPESEKWKDKKILILHQPGFAGGLRDMLRKNGFCGNIGTASFFGTEKWPSEEEDAALAEEEDLTALVKDGGYDLVMGDPLFRRALRGYKNSYVNLPHFAVSGSLYACGTEEEYFRNLREVIAG